MRPRENKREQFFQTSQNKFRSAPDPAVQSYISENAMSLGPLFLAGFFFIEEKHSQEKSIFLGSDTCLCDYHTSSVWPRERRRAPWLRAQKHPRRKGRQPQLTCARVCSIYPHTRQLGWGSVHTPAHDDDVRPTTQDWPGGMREAIKTNYTTP